MKLLIVAAVFVVLFGYRKLPELGKGAGQAIRNFRKGLEEDDEIDISPAASASDTAKAGGTADAEQSRPPAAPALQDTRQTDEPRARRRPLRARPAVKRKA